MKVTITVYEQTDRSETLIEKRGIDVASAKPLNGNNARRILARTFPELGRLYGLTKKNGAWWTMRAVRPTERCKYHHIWRHYYVIADPPAELDKTAPGGHL